jgi:hypothetical protein
VPDPDPTPASRTNRLRILEAAQADVAAGHGDVMTTTIVRGGRRDRRGAPPVLMVALGLLLVPRMAAGLGATTVAVAAS